VSETWVCKKCGAQDDTDSPEFPHYHAQICNGAVVQAELSGSAWSQMFDGAE